MRFNVSFKRIPVAAFTLENRLEGKDRSRETSETAFKIIQTRNNGLDQESSGRSDDER